MKKTFLYLFLWLILTLGLNEIYGRHRNFFESHWDESPVEVYIGGGVKRPGWYHFDKRETTLKEILSKGKGLSVKQRLRKTGKIVIKLSPHMRLDVSDYLPPSSLTG